MLTWSVRAVNTELYASKLDLLQVSQLDFQQMERHDVPFGLGLRFIIIGNMISDYVKSMIY